jgi:hypothetical protein
MSRAKIWEVLDKAGNRITTIVAETQETAAANAAKLFGNQVGMVVDTGAAQPDKGVCCQKCGDKPCGS